MHPSNRASSSGNELAQSQLRSLEGLSKRIVSSLLCLVADTPEEGISKLRTTTWQKNTRDTRDEGGCPGDPWGGGGGVVELGRWKVTGKG